MSEIYEKIRNLNEQAWADRNKDAQKALVMAQEAQSMLDQSQEADVRECVLSLRTQAYCLEHLSRYGEALAIALKTMQMANPLDDRKLTATIDTLLGNIYWRLSDYSSALDHFMHGLRLIQIEPDAETETFLLQGLGALHHDMGNYEEALKYFRRSIEPVVPKDTIGKAIGLNNIAYTLHELKKNEEALPYAVQARELFEENSFSVGKLDALHTLGSIYLELGDIDRASRHFEEGIRAAEQHKNRQQAINCLFGVCEIHEIRGQLDEAREKLIKILQIATEIGSLASQCTAHELLARLYKQLGYYQGALEHYELFHTIHVQIFNEQSERRLHNTHVLLEVENIRKQASVYRTLAATDSLTGLLNRREFFERGAKIVEQARTRQAPVSLLMIDLDHFKSINDEYGHAVGDQVLAMVAMKLKNTLRQNDLAGRYGGDEFVVLMPDIGSQACHKIAERCQKAVSEEPIQVDSLALRMYISVGMTVLKTGRLLVLEDLIQQADQALLTAKKDGRNRIVDLGAL